MPSRTLLIDSDILAFKFAAKSQRTYSFGTAVDELDDVGPKMDEWLAQLTDQLKADDFIVCLSCPSDEGWRKQVLPSYKEHRRGVARPVLLDPLKNYLEANHKSYRRPGLEADDIMGILSTHPTLVKGEKIIVSADKDMKTIPGWLFNPEKDKKPRRIAEEEADYWHLFQTLAGDSTDGYKGCPGIGPGKADKILQNMIDSVPAWTRVVAAFVSKGLTEEDALVQARVARICRASDYDYKNKKVILWTPQQSPAKRTTASTADTTNSKTKPSSASTHSAPKTGVK